MWSWELWWLFPLIMIVVCFIMMRGGLRMCGRGSHDKGTYGSESAMNILDKRYAGGEIDKTEYEKKKRDLKGE